MIDLVDFLEWSPPKWKPKRCDHGWSAVPDAQHMRVCGACGARFGFVIDINPPGIFGTAAAAAGVDVQAAWDARRQVASANWNQVRDSEGTRPPPWFVTVVPPGQDVQTSWDLWLDALGGQMIPETPLKAETKPQRATGRRAKAE